MGMNDELVERARKEWWESICLQGDPMRQPRLTDKAFEAGYRAALSAFPLEELVGALRPFAAFIDQYERKPVKWDDEFIGIHVGTEYEAGLRLSDMKRARAALERVSGLTAQGSGDAR